MGTFFLGIFIFGIGKIISYIFGESEGIQFIISAINVVPFFLIIVSIVYSLIYSFSNQAKFEGKISATEDQVNRYDSLKIYQSYGGKSFLILFISGIIGALFLLIGRIYNLAISNNNVIMASIPAFVFLLSFFVYKRKKWAIALAIILYFFGTSSSFYQMGMGDVKKGYYLGQGLLFLTFTFVFLRAFKIERLRKKYVSDSAEYHREEDGLDEEISPSIIRKETSANQNNLSQIIIAFSTLIFVLGILFYLFYFKPKQELKMLAMSEESEEIEQQINNMELQKEKCLISGEKIKEEIDSERERIDKETMDAFGLKFFEYSFYVSAEKRCVYVIRHIIFGKLADKSAYLIYDNATHEFIRRFEISSQREDYKNFIKEYSENNIILD